MGEGQPLQQTVWGQLDKHMQKKTSDPYSTPLTKISSRQIKDLNITADIIFLEENIGKKLHGIVLCSDFLDMTAKVQAQKHKQEELKTRKLLQSKGNNLQNVKESHVIKGNICKPQTW